MPQPNHRRAAPAGLVRKAFGATTEPVGERQIRVRISTGQVDRAGDVVVQKGIGFANFLKSRTVLWNHDQDHPVAQCLSIDSDAAGDLEALTQFPDAGVSPKSDEVYGLLKAGVINAASIGFLPVEVEPVDGKNPRKGLRIASSELLEFSFVSVPANPGAEVVLRAFREGGTPMMKPMSRKGLYAVSQLAYILHQLGFEVDSAIDEAAREGDGSSVPAQLHEALATLGAALVAMTQEEVAELLDKPGLGFVDPEGDLDVLDDGLILLSMLRGTFKSLRRSASKAGRKFSADTAETMRAHLKSIGQGHQAMCDMLDEADTAEPQSGDDADDSEKAARGRRLRLLTLSAAPAA